ncbi:DNA starvation/stationary phase protection protein [Luteolibacter flavescens]|uniref:DNA starvation/stationary phase protection protein n=1 Tax=Luteolibacter flavescens TaxID=1859460 RepID=A0ABT3FUE1_9BACT|nr:DNA starvation/stationary phase protection protein [Luteolibacter flavescens]MCW1887047.1 DNA starvation/stationary phase protection protein [Luteolibacter flavescens]
MKKNAAKKTPAKTTAANASKTTESLDIGLDAKIRQGSVKALSGILADQHVLYLKTRNFHWNLTGHRFHTLHAFFEAQYTALAEAIDETAERIRMLGAASPGSMKEFLALASLQECAGELIGGDEAIALLRDDHEAAARALRDAVDSTDEAGDAGTADFLTKLLQNHEEAAWMLRSFLE